MNVSTERPTQVAIAVVEHAGQFLVGIRPEGKPLAGLAEFPGGKVNAGETFPEAAVRECWEESGLRVEVVAEYLSTVHRYPHGLLEIHFFRCHLAPANNAADRQDTIKPREPFRWVTIGELATLDFPEANRPLTQMLLQQH